MADIKTTVDGMPKSDIVPDKPVVVETPPANITITKIKAIAKELAQPWQYGTALHRFAKRHGVSIQVVRDIKDALGEKAATFVVVEPIDPKVVE